MITAVAGACLPNTMEWFEALMAFSWKRLNEKGIFCLLFFGISFIAIGWTYECSVLKSKEIRKTGDKEENVYTENLLRWMLMVM